MKDQRVARLGIHRANIKRYERLLGTSLSEVEMHYIEKRLSEERFAIAMLDFMSPPKDHDPNGACEQAKGRDQPGCIRPGRDG